MILKYLTWKGPDQNWYNENTTTRPLKSDSHVPEKFLPN